MPFCALCAVFSRDNMELNTAFVERTELLFGKERFARFMEALDTEPVVSIRYNTSKHAPDDSNTPVILIYHTE